MIAYNLERTYLFLDGAGGVAATAGGPAFWASINETTLPGDTMVMVSDSPSDWPHWEMHPAGEEILVILEGEPRFFLELADGRLETVTAAPGSTVVVPRGAWHRAETLGGFKMLSVTYGRGSTHRSITETDRARAKAVLSART